MQTTIYHYSDEQWHQQLGAALEDKEETQLVLCFAAKSICRQEGLYDVIHRKFPNAQIVICSTSGEIYNDIVADDSLVVTAFRFDKTEIKTADVSILDFTNSYNAATALIDKLSKDNLTYIMVFSDGSLVNGSELVKGLNDATPDNVLLSGGLAGDGADFSSTLVGLNQQPEQGKIIAIGFYGSLIVTHGSQGGWETFGPERIITKANDNVLFMLDDKDALYIYKRYLGDAAEHLPGSALLFPLSVIIPGTEQAVTRTILSIDQENNSMTFAGDVPEGSKVRFMKANFDKLTAAASLAALQTLEGQESSPDFSLLISCVGRKLVLRKRIDEEVEAVIETLGSSTLVSGFYSYGEISPFDNDGDCHLHNQTMTITSFYELT